MRASGVRALTAHLRPVLVLVHAAAGTGLSFLWPATLLQSRALMLARHVAVCVDTAPTWFHQALLLCCMQWATSRVRRADSRPFPSPLRKPNHNNYVLF